MFSIKHNLIFMKCKFELWEKKYKIDIYEHADVWW